MVDIYIHIGLHKTGTTSLQRQFFPACNGINYLTGSSPAVTAFEQAAVTTDPIYYSAEDERNLIWPHLRHDRPNLLSREAFSGALYASLIKHKLDHRSSILLNLRASVPEARILIVLRRQDGLSRSIYRQYLKFGGTARIDRFYGVSGNAAALFPLNRFRFSAYVNYLIEIFPAGVLVLVFEDLLRNPIAFLGKLCAFMSVPMPDIRLAKTNTTTLGSVGMETSRLLNKFFKSQLNPEALLPGIPRIRGHRIEWVWPSLILHDRWPFRAEPRKESQLYKVSNEILERVRDDNQSLDERHNLGLNRYGYY